MAVADKLTEIGKKSLKDEKERQKVDIQMRQMEDAALKAYSADISRGGDITTQALNAMVAFTTAEAEQSSITANQVVPGPSALPRRAIDPLLPPIDVLEDEERSKREKMKRKSGSGGSVTGQDPSMWVEAKSDDRHTYYWNVKTGGTFDQLQMTNLRSTNI